MLVWFQDGFDLCIENLSDEMREDYLLSVKKAIGMYTNLFSFLEAISCDSVIQKKAVIDLFNMLWKFALMIEALRVPCGHLHHSFNVVSSWLCQLKFNSWSHTVYHSIHLYRIVFLTSSQFHCGIKFDVAYN